MLHLKWDFWEFHFFVFITEKQREKSTSPNASLYRPKSLQFFRTIHLNQSQSKGQVPQHYGKQTIHDMHFIKLSPYLSALILKGNP